MLNSKQLIEKTGISRATLNNYVALGILPNPIVKPPESDATKATRLGYFPDEALERIQLVQKLKKEGMSIADIARKLAKPDRQYPAAIPVTSENSNSKASQGREPLSRLSVELSVDNFPGPAYMVNNNFELIWWNDAAVKSLFNCEEEMPGDLVSRNLLGLLFDSFRDLDDTRLI